MGEKGRRKIMSKVARYFKLPTISITAKLNIKVIPLKRRSIYPIVSFISGITFDIK